jgi:hypothetical protein
MIANYLCLFECKLFMFIWFSNILNNFIVTYILVLFVKLAKKWLNYSQLVARSGSRPENASRYWMHPHPNGPSAGAGDFCPRANPNEFIWGLKWVGLLDIPLSNLECLEAQRRLWHVGDLFNSFISKFIQPKNQRRDSLYLFDTIYAQRPNRYKVMRETSYNLQIDQW